MRKESPEESTFLGHRPGLLEAPGSFRDAKRAWVGPEVPFRKSMMGVTVWADAEKWALFADDTD
jgi:hypothetical protein